MRYIKISSVIYQTIICLLVLFSSTFFICSDFGIIKHYQASCQVDEAHHDLNALKKEIVLIEKEIYNWKTDSFYVEKMAREDLGMGYRDEIVYLLKG